MESLNTGDWLRPLFRILATPALRTRTRTNTNPYDTKANAAGRRGQERICGLSLWSNDFLHWKFKLKLSSQVTPQSKGFPLSDQNVVTVAIRILLMALIAILFPDIQPFLAQRDGVPSAISFLEARYLLCCWCGSRFSSPMAGGYTHLTDFEINLHQFDFTFFCEVSPPTGAHMHKDYCSQ